jgi:enamine deaminase RidA (YjgF/YER057c/UK114 family)
MSEQVVATISTPSPVRKGRGKLLMRKSRVVSATIRCFDGSDGMEFFRMDGNRAAKLPFSDAVRVGEVLYLSGQMGIKPGTMTISDLLQARPIADALGLRRERPCARWRRRDGVLGARALVPPHPRSIPARAECKTPSAENSSGLACIFANLRVTRYPFSSDPRLRGDKSGREEYVRAEARPLSPARKGQGGRALRESAQE